MPVGNSSVPERSTSGEVIELLGIAEVETRTLFQIGDPNLSSTNVESLLESRQILDILLSKHETGC